MSSRTQVTKPEPRRSRRTSKKEQTKPTSGDIKTAFKMAASKEKMFKGPEVVVNKNQLDEEGDNAFSSQESIASIASDAPMSEVTVQEAATQVSPIELSEDHDNQSATGSRDVAITIDSDKEQLLEALRELTQKFDKLDDIVNHPKKGIGAQVVNLTLKGDNLHTDIHSASDGLLVKTAKMQEKIDATSTKAEHLEQGQDRTTKMLAENKRLSRDLVTTQGLLQKYSQKIHNLEQRVLDLTRRGMEQNLVFHAIEECADPKLENCHETIIQFCKNFLNIDMQEEAIWKVYRMGQLRRDKARPIFAKLSYSAKEKIMSKVNLLKDKRNSHDQVRFVAEQIPEGISEVKKAVSKKASALKKIEEKKPIQQRRSIKVISDKILVGGEVVKSDVSTPQPYELFPSVEEQKKIDAISQKIKEDNPFYLNNSTFVGLAVKVKSLIDTNNAYKAVMQRFPYMDHVTMAYNFKEADTDTIKVGSCDDLEYGGGACISKFLYENKLRNVAVFVVRRYGGIHLGYNRFKAIIQAATGASKLLHPEAFP